MFVLKSAEASILEREMLLRAICAYSQNLPLGITKNYSLMVGDSEQSDFLLQIHGLKN